MKTYHAIDRDGLLVSGEHSAAVIANDEHILVPMDEVNDPAGRHINCPACTEALAQRMGGSLRRPTPPVFESLEEGG